MKVSEIMTVVVEVAAPEDSVQTAAQLMDDTGVGVLPVCDGERLVGLVTDRDITVRAVAEGRSPASCVVREIMTTDVNYAFQDDEIGDVARKMAECQVHRLPILDRNKALVGIVSGDIALEDMDKGATAEALHGIAQPTGGHEQ